MGNTVSRATARREPRPPHSAFATPAPGVCEYRGEGKIAGPLKTCRAVSGNPGNLSDNPSVRVRLCQELSVDLAGVVVGGLGVGAFGLAVGAGLFLPALVDPVQGPLDAAAAGADGLVVDQHENRIRVAGGEDAHGDPTAAVDGHVVERDLARR